MKRLCVFYKNADAFVGKPIEWMVCGECRQKLLRGSLIKDVFKPYQEALLKITELERTVEDLRYELIEEYPD